MSSVFFIASKIFWFIFSPDSFFVGLLIVCLLCFWFNATKKGLLLLHIIVITALVITFLPVGKWLLYPLEKQFSPMRTLPDRVDGILMLAGSEDLLQSGYWQQPHMNQAVERYTAFIHLVRRFPHAKHVFSGGSGSLDQSSINSADVARSLFGQLGLNTDSILFESKSRNTFENGLLSRKIVDPGPNESWIVVTSASHMPRAIGVFYKLNWPVIPYPVDYRSNPEQLTQFMINFSGNLEDLRSSLHEWAGLVVYYLTGKSARLFPTRTLIKQ